jgi:hypothetical protein
MNSRFFILSLSLMAACTAGPESPSLYQSFGPVVSFNFKDVPSGENIAGATLQLSLVSFLPGVEAPNSECDEHAGSTMLDSFIAEGAEFRIPPINTQSSYNLSEACARRYLEALNFLKVNAEPYRAIDSGGMGLALGTWTPGAYDLVYARSPTTFMPFGPAGAAVTIPEGYSWLRRTCGAAGNTELSIVPTSETLDLHRGGSIMMPRPLGYGGISTAETIERGLVPCGDPPPARDLGTRVSFDRAKELLWSADGASLFYLAPDAQDPNGAVGIRQVKLSEHTTSDIAVVNDASALQTGATGVLYVTANEITYALSLATGVPATLQALPFTGIPHLSPDGLWFAFDGGGAVHLWSVPAAALTTSITGGYFAWSPDSRLLYGSTLAPEVPGASPRFELSIASPTAPSQAGSCGVLSSLHRAQGQLTWESEYPQVAHAPQSWSIESTIPFPGCQNCFGISLHDPVTGVERPILDASAGMVDLVHTHPVAGFVFTWARTCQGLYNTLCTHLLLRIRLADGIAETIAIADQEMPVALSWDNRRVALAAANGIYVKELPQ